MRLLFAAVTAVVLAAGFAGAAPVPANKQPLVTIQAQSMEKIEADMTKFVELIGGKEYAEKFTAFMKKDWAIFVAVSGLDPKKPFLGYVESDGEIGRTTGAILLPVSNKTLFLEFLPKIPQGNEIKIEKLAGADEIYEVTRANGDFPVRVLLRFANDYAYFGINVQPKDLDAAKLIPPANLMNPKETALASVRLNPGSLPDASRKGLLKNLDTLLDDAQAKQKQNPAGDKFSDKALEGYASFAKKLAGQALNETETAILDLVADPKTAELGIEIRVAPKKGSAAAKEIAARKPELNPLADFMSDQVAASFFQTSFGQKELREATTAMYESYKKKLADDPPPEAFKALAEEGIDLLVRSQAAGKADYSVAAYGPDKKNQFHFAGVITCDDPTKLEKILRDLHANEAPEEIKKEIELDVAKFGKVVIHEVQIANLPNVPPMFPKGTACIAFAPAAIFVTHGPESIAMMKQLIVAKPAASQPFEANLNPTRLVKLIASIDENVAKQAEEILGKDDRLISALGITVLGGDTLKIRVGMHANVIPKLIMYYGMLQKGPGN
jgi:hypothetical protein